MLGKFSGNLCDGTVTQLSILGQPLSAKWMEKLFLEKGDDFWNEKSINKFKIYFLKCR